MLLLTLVLSLTHVISLTTEQLKKAIPYNAKKKDIAQKFINTARTHTRVISLMRASYLYTAIRQQCHYCPACALLRQSSPRHATTNYIYIYIYIFPLAKVLGKKDARVYTLEKPQVHTRGRTVTACNANIPRQAGNSIKHN